MEIVPFWPPRCSPHCVIHHRNHPRTSIRLQYYSLFTETSTQKFGWCPATSLGGGRVHHRRDLTTKGYCPTTKDHCSNGSLAILKLSQMPHLNKWQLINDLSHPAAHSVNDGIPKSLCSLSYVMVDTAIWHILNTGTGAPLAKIDNKHAFAFYLFTLLIAIFSWKGDLFIDTCPPFGL